MNVLRQAEDVARKHWPRGWGWKILFIVLIVVLSLVILACLIVWLFGRLVKSITTGGFRNSNLYFPGNRR